MERLQKVIANSGYTSRRHAEILIKEGKVKVNGKIVKELGTKVNINDEIEVEGNSLAKKEDKVYFLLNKPREVISSASDKKGRKTVVSLINTDKRIYPIGRLDYDTTGLLLLTNDGELTNILMHPKNEVPKTYVAKIEGNLSPKEFYSLKKGLIIENRKVIPNYVKVRKSIQDKYDIVEITIVEGRNHIIKKIFESLHHSVIKLKRQSYAFLTLDNLKSGEYRELSIKEVKKLYSLHK